MGLNFDIIALDVDGTLITDGHVLTAEVREAVHDAAAHGAEIVLCTGRGPANTLPILEELGLTGTLITHNGAATVDAASREVLHQYEIDTAEMLRFLTCFRERGLHYDINTAFEMMIESLSPEAEAMYSRYGASPNWRDAGAPLPNGLVKVSVFGRKPAMDALEKEFGTWNHRLQHIRSGDFFIDIQHPDANKGTALELFASMRGVPRSRVMAIGNYFNDVGMLKFAGLGVAVANSPEGVKEAADAVTLSNEEHGVAHALRTYAWS